MVYHGPSDGCHACRKAKKLCGLERPACRRCVRLGKNCTGYPTEKAFEIRDETQIVVLKARGVKDAKHARIGSGSCCDVFSVLPPSPESTLDDHMGDTQRSTLQVIPSTMSMKPQADDVAMGYFLQQFIQPSGAWDFLRHYATHSEDQEYLNLAMKACGMAAFNNVRHVDQGRLYAQSLYSKALTSLNITLSDDNARKADACLIAVVVMGYYEV